MKNALILHGADGSSRENWFPWLKMELEKRGYKVWVPNLPNSKTPILRDWLDAIFSNKDGHFDSNSIIVGHSMGATLALRLLEKIQGNVKINKAVLVAGPVELGTKPEYFIYKKDLVTPRFNWPKIKKSAKQFYFIHSDNDKYQCGKEQGEIMKQNLGGELIVISGGGHFSSEESLEYTQFPLLLGLIK